MLTVSPYMSLHLLNTGFNQFDKWYCWCELQHTFDLIPSYYDLNLLYILHRYALVLILVLNGVDWSSRSDHYGGCYYFSSTHHRTTNSAVYANSTSKLDMILMIDTDMIRFIKQDNRSIILETWILSWGAFFDLPGRFVKEALNGFHIEYDLHRLDSLLYICIRRGC
jgi:hypothetical protein